MNKIREIKILTGIRFFAALHVVLYHNLYLFGDIASSLPRPLLVFISKGESAVSFFFILSGFILSHVYYPKMNTIREKKQYFFARVSRLYPLYFLAMLIDIPRVLSYFYSKYDVSVATLKTGVSAIAYMAMVQSWVPNLTPVWNSPAWSLSCEIFFYLCFIPFMGKILQASKKQFLIIVFYAIPLICYFVCINSIDTDQAYFKTLWRSLPALRVFEFLIGIALYGLVLRPTSLVDFVKKYSSQVFWLTTALSFSFTWLFDHIDEKLFPHLVLAPCFMLMILSASFDDIRFSRVLTNRTITYLGLASFSLYIVHQPIKYYFELFLTPSLLAGIIYLVGSVLISCLLFKAFESPMQKKIRNSLQRFC